MPEVQEYQSGPQGSVSLADLNNLGVRGSSAPEFSSEPAEAAEPKPEPKTSPTKEPADLPTRPLPSPGEDKEQGEEAETEPAEAKNGQHKLSRYEKTKRRIAEVKKREAALEARERQLVELENRRVEAERKASEPDYTLGDLRKYKAQWEQEGNYDLAAKAEAEIERMEKLEADKLEQVQVPRPGTKAFTDLWHKAEKELYDYDPEFMRTGTRMDTALRQLMASPDGELFRSHPYGIYAAYNQAKLGLTLADLEAERAKTKTYEKEIHRLNGLLGIGGGAPARGSGPFEIRDFARLSTKDMRRHLLASAET